MREVQGQLLRPGEHFEAFMDPFAAAQQGDLGPQDVLNVIQSRTHHLFADYLNGKDIETAPLQGLCGKLGCKESGNSPREFFENVYFFLQSEQGQAEGKRESLTVQDWQETGNEFDRSFAKIQELLLRIEPYLLGAYLHGSFGDGTAVRNYSDVDMLLIVREKAIETREALLSIRKCLTHVMREVYVVDPHQHHGPRILAEHDLRAYSTSYLPPVALSGAKRLVGDLRLEFFLREDSLERTNALWRFVQQMRKTFRMQEFPPSLTGNMLKDKKRGELYSLKYFTSFVMLLPSLFFLARGEPCPKAESFSKLGAHLSAPILQACTDIRALYPQEVFFQRNGLYSLFLRADQKRARTLLQPSRIPPAFWDMLGEHYFQDALQFAEDLWNAAR